MKQTFDAVILDSGVASDNRILGRCPPVEAVTFSLDKGNILTCTQGGEDTLGHGTAIAAILRQSAPDASILMGKLFDSFDGVEEELLLRTLEYLAEHVDCKIIHLSLGINVCQDEARLYDVCRRLDKRGTVLVSAFDNNGGISYPAAFDCVLGVRSGGRCYKKCDIEYYGDSVVNLGAMGRMQRVAWLKPEVLFMQGSSFAAAHVTAMVLTLLGQGCAGRGQVLQELRTIAIPQPPPPPPAARLGGVPALFPIKRAALFPFNKEMHSLVRYASMLPFTISAVYASRYSMMVGSTTCKLMEDSCVEELCVKDIRHIDWSGFDTLILGHMDEWMEASNQKHLKKELIESALARKKKLVAFDDLSTLSIPEGDSVYYPRIFPEDIPEKNRFGMLYEIPKPVLGVFGTSSKQGKFTLQLRLRQKLWERGYKAGHLGTEPSALLFGCDEVFPMGYNASVYIGEYDTVRCLNAMMHHISCRENDLILVGSQSGTVLYDNSNLLYFPLAQYHFLLGTQPDACLLLVNPYDDFEYIRRTVAFLESAVTSKVLALVVFPKALEQNWAGVYGRKVPLPEEEYRTLSQRLRDAFQRPVFLLGRDEDLDALTQEILNFFGAGED